MKRFALAFVAVALVGCGGGGSAQQDVIDQWVANAITAMQSGNINAVSALISENYYDDCQTKQDVMADWQTVFSQGGTVTVLEYTVSQKLVVGNQAGFDGTLRVRVTGPNGFAEYTLAEGDPTYLLNENGVWREYGNRLCQ